MSTYQRGLSVKAKWTIIMSIFILITFTLFAGLFYRNTSHLIQNEGRVRMEKTITDLVSKLSLQNENLTKESTKEILTKQLPKEGKSNGDGLLISELSQSEAFIYIYDKDQKLIFSNRPKKQNMAVKPIIMKTTLHDIKNIPGYTKGEKVVSINTKQTIGYVQIFYELPNLLSIQHEIFGNILIFVLIWIVLVVIFEQLISRVFIRPIDNLTQMVEDIKANPLTTRRTDLPKFKDEIWVFTKLFNLMIDQMQQYIEQQEQFVSDVSHELRTPVAIMEGHLKMLERWGKDDPEVQEESIAASLQELERMKSLIQEMLELSRIEQSEIQHYKESAPAKEVITQVVNNFRMIHPDFKFIFDDDLKQELIVAMYRNHLEQLLLIILDNAVKYSKEDKKIVHVSASQNPHYLEIAIQDFGEGISEENLKKIFDRFYRVDKARSREKGGNGLGLSIAQKLISIYNGKLNVDSVEGQGSIFRIEIPIFSDDYHSKEDE